MRANCGPFPRRELVTSGKACFERMLTRDTVGGVGIVQSVGGVALSFAHVRTHNAGGAGWREKRWCSFLASCRELTLASNLSMSITPRPRRDRPWWSCEATVTSSMSNHQISAKVLWSLTEMYIEKSQSHTRRPRWIQETQGPNKVGRESDGAVMAKRGYWQDPTETDAYVDPQTQSMCWMVWTPKRPQASCTIETDCIGI